jgi:hypothetical protein
MREVGGILVATRGEEMSDKPETLKGEHARQVAESNRYDPDMVRAALARLRQLAKDLPQVDAVAIVRDTREGADRGVR